MGGQHQPPLHATAGPCPAVSLHNARSHGVTLLSRRYSGGPRSISHMVASPPPSSQVDAETQHHLVQLLGCALLPHDQHLAFQPPVGVKLVLLQKISAW